MHKFGDLLLVAFNPVRDVFCEVVGVGCLVQPLRENVLHFVELLNHGRDDEIEHAADDHHNHQESHDDAQRPDAQMELVFDEFHNRIEQIGQQPCNEEGQQHAAQIIEQQQHGQHNGADACPTNKPVECNLFHLECFLFFFANSLLETVSAKWLVFCLLAQHHAMGVGHQPMAHIGQRATFHADGVHLSYFVGYGTERRHGAKGHPFVIHV